MVDIDDKLFWISGHGWPGDAYGQVFLGRAVRQLGKALFPTDWTGAEMVTERPYPRDVFYIDGEEAATPKPLFFIEVHLLDILARVIRENHPEIGLQFTPGRTRRPVLTVEQYMTALMTIERVNPVRGAALARRAKVSAELASALRDGKIKFTLLPDQGGEFLTETQPFWWNIPSTAHRWTRCKMSPSDPYSTAFAGVGFMHIFVDGADLASFVAGHRKPETAAAPPMQQSSNETFAAALALLSNWNPPKRTIRAFESHCKENGISSKIAREAYGTLGAAKGRKRV